MGLAETCLLFFLSRLIKAKLVLLDSMSAKLLEFPDLKTQEMEGGGRDQTEIIHIVSLWAMTEGPIDCTSSQENLSIPVKASFKSSPS